MAERTKLNEGKTKIIWSDPKRTDRVIIQSKDDITAGNGARHDLIEGKGALSNSTTCDCFELLESKNMLTHFAGRVDKTSFLAKRADMILIECVARRRAAGSYLKRNQNVDSGARFSDLEIEFYFKDNDMGDPLMVHDFVRRRIMLFNAGVPLNAGLISELPLEEPHKLYPRISKLRHFVERVFSIIETAWAYQKVELIDLKIECGFVGTSYPEIVVADVIDNDSWRIWPWGDKSQEKSKQVYRDAPKVTPEVLAQVRANYAWVAERTAKFLE
ncbi:MAG: phosphoribosylaminoimidazolesuccinocarboxamide synthase [Parcubacteria group bacterium]|nr:phosphoribosylaminoimidazolesuccinocarboxamide synthase [Parcubacteria group bacterium]|tara:strand:+ start:3435 stop:4253 length:819 start_codon:yes stop_codon:yes gene_type:complete